MQGKFRNRLKEIVEKELSCSAHSMDHILRVHELCMALAKSEPDADLEVLEAAVLLHDIARVREDEDYSGNIDHAVLGSVLAEKVLKDIGFPAEKIEKVRQCIITHRFRTGNEPKTIEAKILFDADKLDILGAIGIARLFMVAGEYSEKTSRLRITSGKILWAARQTAGLRTAQSTRPILSSRQSLFIFQRGCIQRKRKR